VKIAQALSCSGSFRPRCACLKTSQSGKGNTHCPVPGHGKGRGDRGPSLSVAEKNGNPLVHCQAGCTQDEVIATLKKRGLWSHPAARAERRRQQKAEPTSNDVVKKSSVLVKKTEIKHVFKDIEGTHLATKIRHEYTNGEKKFTWIMPDGSFGLKGLNTVDLLYGAEQLEGLPEGSTVVFTEGEKKAQSLINKGIVAVSSAGGAGVIPSTMALEPLVTFDVVCWADNDGAGQSHMRGICDRLRELGCNNIRQVDWPEAPLKGDAYDAVLLGVNVQGLIASAPPYPTTQTPELVADDGSKLTPGNIGLSIIAAGYRFATGGGQLWMYENGVYRPGEERLRRILITKLGPNEWTTHRERSVIRWFMGGSPELLEKPASNLINMRNGLFNLSTNKLEEHTPDYLTNVQLEIDYDPAAECPRIRQFISEIVAADAEVTVYEFSGQVWVGDNSSQKAGLLAGDGANGKTTFMNVLKKGLGRRNFSSVSLEDLNRNRFSAAELYGKLANICPDINGDHLPDMSKFKALVGGDQGVLAEFKYGQPFTFDPFATLIFSANKIPTSDDVSHGYLRKWLPIEFPNTFPINRNLLKELTTPQELSGFFNLSIKAWKACRGVFTEGASIQQARMMLTESVDPFLGFLKEWVVVAADAKVKRPELYQAYKSWCRDNKGQVLSPQNFNRKIVKTTNATVRVLHGTETWYGIGLIWDGLDD